MIRDEQDKKLLAFADKHSITLQRKGEVGFGRTCVGFTHSGGNYIDLRPYDMKSIEPIDGFYDDGRLDAPNGVEAYHKHDCLCVLANGLAALGEDEESADYEKALDQLLLWVEHLEKQGEVEVVEFSTGATGMQAMVSGSTGYALRFKTPAAT